MKDGTVINLADMEDSHIENAIDMMRRQVVRLNEKIDSAVRIEAKLAGERNRRRDARSATRRAERQARKKNLTLPIQEATVPVGRMFREDD